VPGCFAHTFALSLPNFDFIIARDDRAEFTSGANEVSATNVNDVREDKIEFIFQYLCLWYRLIGSLITLWN